MKDGTEKAGEQLTRADVELIIKIAQERAELVNELKAALQRDDLGRVINLARLLCGMPEEMTQ